LAANEARHCFDALRVAACRYVARGGGSELDALHARAAAGAKKRSREDDAALDSSAVSYDALYEVFGDKLVPDMHSATMRSVLL
jgi:hypothetical protein